MQEKTVFTDIRKNQREISSGWDVPGEETSCPKGQEDKRGENCIRTTQPCKTTGVFPKAENVTHVCFQANGLFLEGKEAVPLPHVPASVYTDLLCDSSPLLSLAHSEPWHVLGPLGRKLLGFWQIKPLFSTHEGRQRSTESTAPRPKRSRVLHGYRLKRQERASEGKTGATKLV